MDLGGEETAWWRPAVAVEEINTKTQTAQQNDM